MAKIATAINIKSIDATITYTTERSKGLYVPPLGSAGGVDSTMIVGRSENLTQEVGYTNFHRNVEIIVDGKVVSTGILGFPVDTFTGKSTWNPTTYALAEPNSNYPEGHTITKVKATKLGPDSYQYALFYDQSNNLIGVSAPFPQKTEVTEDNIGIVPTFYQTYSHSQLIQHAREEYPDYSGFITALSAMTHGAARVFLCMLYTRASNESEYTAVGNIGGPQAYIPFTNEYEYLAAISAEQSIWDQSVIDAINNYGG